MSTADWMVSTKTLSVSLTKFEDRRNNCQRQISVACCQMAPQLAHFCGLIRPGPCSVDIYWLTPLCSERLQTTNKTLAYELATAYEYLGL
jgi:hypothetical protein